MSGLPFSASIFFSITVRKDHQKRFTSSRQDQHHTFAVELRGILSLQPSIRSSLPGPRSPCHSIDEIEMAGNSFSGKLVNTCVQRGENHRNSGVCLYNSWGSSDPQHVKTPLQGEGPPLHAPHPSSSAPQAPSLFLFS